MDQKNVLLAFVLSMLILLGWGMLFPTPEQPAQQTMVAESSVTTEKMLTEPNLPDIEHITISRQSENPATPVVAANLDELLPLIENNVLSIAMNRRGWLVEASLANYADGLHSATKVQVLDRKDPHAMYINTGVVGQTVNAAGFSEIERSVVDGNNTVRYQTILENGLVWERVLQLTSGSYQLDVEDRVYGGAGSKMYRQVVERYPSTDDSTFYEYVGPIGLMNDQLQEVAFDDLNEAGTVRLAAIGGWTGIMNRYFIAALYGAQDQDYRYYYKGDGRSYQAGMLDDGTVDQGDMVFRSSMYVGPKSIPVLKELNMGLERSVDFGWFAFIAKPLHDALTWFYSFFPNYGISILLLVLIIKIVFFWPTQKSYESMAGMRKLQPEQKRLQERYGDDRQRLGQEMMELYRKNKVNPLGGCLPILIQIPVFFALYKVLLMSIEMRHAPLFGWIQDLSAQDPYFVLPVLMGISMFIQQKLNPQPADPMQAKIMSFLPILFTVMFLFFPAGLVLYWVVNNVLSIIQQRLVMHRMGVE